MGSPRAGAACRARRTAADVQLYASPPGGARNRATLARLGYGLIVSPVTERMARAWTGPVMLDNGAWTAFQSGVPFDFAAFAAFAERWAGRARAIIAPDIVGDWIATAELFREWAPRLRMLGYRVLCAAQDGATAGDLVRLGADGVALGGTTAWKVAQIRHPQWRTFAERHVLRVNTRSRLRACIAAGWASCDGTGATLFSLHAEKMHRWRTEPVQTAFC